MRLPQEARGFFWFLALAAASVRVYRWALEWGAASWQAAWFSGMALYQGGFWLVALSDLLVSTYWPAVALRLKLRPRRAETNSFASMATLSLLNQASQLVLTYVAFGVSPHAASSSAPVSVARASAFALAGFLMYDLFFWLGHRALHLPALYSLAHKTHHSSVGTCAASAHYMSPLDFLLESSGALVLCIVVHCMLGFPDLAFALALSLSGFNAALVHSAWDVWWLPSPAQHFAHHARSNVNYGIGVVDAIAGTNS